MYKGWAMELLERVRMNEGKYPRELIVLASCT